MVSMAYDVLILFPVLYLHRKRTLCPLNKLVVYMVYGFMCDPVV